MTDDSRVMQVLHTTTTDAIGNAARDAIIYGTGVMIINQEMQICHVPMEKYLELSQALEEACVLHKVTPQPTESKP